jgi:dUTP pyrophosphatase
MNTEERLMELMDEIDKLSEKVRNALRVLRIKEGNIVKVKKVRSDAILPTYATDGSAAMDIYYCGYSPIILPVNQTIPILYGSGIAVEIPNGYQISIRPRSGLGKLGILLTNSPGTIDSDYRGEIGILLQNMSDRDYKINIGDRIGQIILERVYNIIFEEVDELSNTERGEGGFGSTGK